MEVLKMDFFAYFYRVSDVFNVRLTIRLFEKSSHTPQYEEPELFDEALLQWLSLRT